VSGNRWRIIVLLMCALGCGSSDNASRSPANQTSTESDGNVVNEAEAEPETNPTDLLVDYDNRIVGGLSLAIVTDKEESGAHVIRHDGQFEVLFTNHSTKPIRLWNKGCQPGYRALSFRVEDGDSPPCLMHKRPQHESSWKNTHPITITIPPGETTSLNVGPPDIWTEREWKNAPEPNTGKSVLLAAIFETKPTALSQEHGVWTGRVNSEPIEALVVNPELRTPHEYLWSHCPKQALAMIKADRTWINKKDDDSRTPLHLAARFGFVDVVRWLLSHDADVDPKAYNDFTPLLLTNHTEVVRLLLQHGANVNASGASGTALQTSAHDFAYFPKTDSRRDDPWTITRILLDAGAEYDIRSACCLDDVDRVRVLVADKQQVLDMEAMRLAATFGRVEIVKLLLEHGADSEHVYYGGLPLSYFAIKHRGVLKLLFDAGADPNVPINYSGNGMGPSESTLLHQAAARGIIESAKLLAARGVNVDRTNPWGLTPLHVASFSGQTAVVDWLLRNKADANARTEEGVTPMSFAASEIRPDAEDENAEYLAVIRTLERAGVKVDVFAAISCNDVQRVTDILRTDTKAGEDRQSRGRPALHRAVTLDRREIAKLLLDNGTDPDVRSQEEGVGHGNETALLQAAFWGRLEIAKLLINSGANVNAKADRSVVPLHEAARMGHVELARLLLQHGANVNATDDDGKTPLDWAGMYGEVPEMSKLLVSFSPIERPTK
jgi:ankyrin repeat protein